MKNASEELRRVFKMLPANDQHQIIECWRRWSDGTPTVHVLSKVELQRFHVRWAGTNGVTFYLREDFFSCAHQVPAAVLDAALGHELAHSFYALDDFFVRVTEDLHVLTRRIGIGPETFFSRALRRADEYSRARIRKDFTEGKAWLKAQAWGFPQADAIAWLEQNLP
jgi:hypothetical protein